MRSNSVKSKTLLTLASLVLPGVFESASADTIVPIDQTRSVITFLIVPQCSGAGSDKDAADGFGPFDSIIETLIDCDSGLGFGSGSQQSQIGPNSLMASGIGISEALGPAQEIIHASGVSYFSVTFELASESEFTMEGLLSAESLGSPLGASVSASLRDSNNQVVFGFIVDPGPDGGPNTQVIEESGLLNPGVYTLWARAEILIDNEVPPGLSGEAAFDFVFVAETVCVADLDGDGNVGAFDLAMLLGGWGPCPVCPADLDGDGNVGPFDLALLLGNWGPCQ